MVAQQDLGAATAALNTALAQAQGEFPSIPRDRTVTVQTKTGSSYRFSYATLDGILSACRPVLAKHGLAVTQLLEHVDGQLAIRTELRHAEGGVLSSSFPLEHAPSSPQQLGSLITYMRRYALAPLLGVAAEEDDDAQQASDAPKRKRRKQPLTDPEVPFSDHPEPGKNVPDETLRATEPQKGKLDILVGGLRVQGHLTTQQVWEAIAFQRSMGADELILELQGVGDDGVLHWAPLREALTRAEARNLIDRLMRLQDRVMNSEPAA